MITVYVRTQLPVKQALKVKLVSELSASPHYQGVMRELSLKD